MGLGLLKVIIGWVEKHFTKCNRFDISYTPKQVTFKLYVLTEEDTDFLISETNELRDILDKLGYEGFTVKPLVDDYIVIQVYF